MAKISKKGGSPKLVEPTKPQISTLFSVGPKKIEKLESTNWEAYTDYYYHKMPLSTLVNLVTDKGYKIENVTLAFRSGQTVINCNCSQQDLEIANIKYAADMVVYEAALKAARIKALREELEKLETEGRELV